MPHITPILKTVIIMIRTIRINHTQFQIIIITIPTDGASITVITIIALTGTQESDSIIIVSVGLGVVMGTAHLMCGYHHLGITVDMLHIQVGILMTFIGITTGAIEITDIQVRDMVAGILQEMK